ncbi:RecB family exonuclease [Bradyrhizobium ivorense]|uniref:RecB family exonuclease n=1 Tax=Bradyrhizobium ivorense TaxID=2511166 RepID=UPI00155A38A2|nr:PD-(D/E)XK nuclease family protein [Bradyrhizobium ivorense]
MAKFAQASQRPARALSLLPGGPAAARGILAHRVIEQWFKGEGSDDPATVFAAIYEALREELMADPARTAFADLAEVFGPAEWSGFRAWVLRRCETLGRNYPGRRRGETSDRTGHRPLLGAEVSLTSEALRLKGRADRIRRVAAESYEIRDYKSGAVLDDDGEVKESIALQLQAYGLMFLEAMPSAEVTLIVDVGKEIPVGFDEATRARARERIEALLAPVPEAGHYPMESLAKPGADCLGCRIRHLCRAYLTQAPSWWLAYPDKSARISYDCWGTVQAVNAGAMDVTLKDAAGRRIRVDRLAHRHGIAASFVGRAIWLFDLESPGPSRDFKGNRYHPRVFYELPRDRRERRAWGAQVFLEPEGTDALKAGAR